MMHIGPMQKNTTFSGAKLAAARGDLRREALAVVADVHVATIQRWEEGETEPDASQLAALARYLNRPLEFFFVSCVA